MSKKDQKKGNVSGRRPPSTARSNDSLLSSPVLAPMESPHKQLQGPNIWNRLSLSMAQSLDGGSIPEPRSGHHTCFHDDVLYSFGGFNVYHKTFPVYSFDAENAKWSEVVFAGKIPTGRMGFGCATINHSVFVFGGNRDTVYYNDLYEFGFETQKCIGIPSKGQAMPPKRYGHAMCSVKHPSGSDLVCVFGGCTAKDILSDFWTFQPTDRTWKQVVSTLIEDDPDLVPCARGFCSMTAWGSKVYMYGGFGKGDQCLNDLWVMDDMEYGDWREICIGVGGLRPGPRMNHSLVDMMDGTLVLFGGTNWSHYNELWVFDTNEEVWRPFEGVDDEAWVEAPTPRAMAGVCVRPADKVLFVYGGMTGHVKLNDMYCIWFDSSWYQPHKLLGPEPSNMHYDRYDSLFFDD